jgi:dUTP pyrophosphatase
MPNDNKLSTQIDFSRVSISNKDIPVFSTDKVITKSFIPITFEITDQRLEQFDFNSNSSNEAGIDLRACTINVTTLQPNEVKLIGSGLRFQCPLDNMVGLILPHSELGHKEGIIIGNGTGVINSDYTGEVNVSVWNRSNKIIDILPLDLIAQLVFIPKFPISLVRGVVKENYQRGEKDLRIFGVI